MTVRYCIGIDEVGLGAWAGPFVVAAVVCRLDWEPPAQVRDSKKIPPAIREQLVEKVLVPPAIEDNWIALRESNDLKDSRYLSQFVLEIMTEVAGYALVHYPDSIIVADGVRVPKFPGVSSIAMAKADDLVPAVSAASIVAKVYRDNLMREYAKEYPQYGFERNAGYGTEYHRRAIKNHGLCPIHRLAYKPIRNALRRHKALVRSGHGHHRGAQR